MFVENFKIALSQLAASKLRTFLTALGIIIGLSSVIIIMTVGDAMNNMALESMGSMGANKFTLYVTEKPSDDGSVGNVRDWKESDKISNDMIDKTLEHFKGKIKGVSLKEEVTQTEITQGNKSAAVSLNGVNDIALEQEKLKLLAGNNITASDMKNSRSVALVSDRYVNKLYDGDWQAALGKQVEIVVNNKYYIYTIVGVYQAPMNDGFFGSGGNIDDMPSDIFVPVKTTERQSGGNSAFYNIDLIAETGADMEALTADVPQWINDTFYASNDAYMVEAYNMQSYVEEMTDMVNTIKLAFMAIAAISLLVGGIGVMNIMIVTITERTREIGTRKALGATNNSIRMQFITEAVVVCLMGGIVGVSLGVAAGYGITSFMKVPTFTSISGIVGCLLFSMSFGVLFGYLPANKAAKMNPIDALRYE
ncbi:MAG: ABC transporter permease [Clostridia bacterium]|nr:ABC transporter permease [Clostridia bacterium]